MLSFKKDNRIICGIEIGQHSVKLLAVNKKNNSIIQDIEHIEEPVFETGKTIINPKKKKLLTDILKSMINRNNLNIKDVRVIIPSNCVCLRRLDMVAMPSRDLLKALFFEVKRQQIPFSDRDTIIDYIIFNEYEKDNNKRYDICLVVAPDRLIQDIKDIVNETGLKIDRLEISSITYLRLLKHISAIEDNNTFLVVDIGADKTEINIYDDEVPVIQRNIQMGGLTISRNIQDELKIDFDSAETKKKQLEAKISNHTGLQINKETDKIWETIVKPVMMLIINDIKRSIQLAMPKLKHKKISKIFLTGGTSLFKNINQYFAENLNFEIELISYSIFIHYDKQIVYKTISPMYHLLLGLTIVESDRYFINLAGSQMQELHTIERRKNRRDRRKSDRSNKPDRRRTNYKPGGTFPAIDTKKIFNFFSAFPKKVIAASGIIILILLAGIFYYYKYELIRYKKIYDLKSTELNNINIDYNKSNVCSKTNDEIKKSLNIIHNVELSHGRIELILKSITNVFPNGMMLNNINFTYSPEIKKYNIEFSGYSFSTDSINLFINNLGRIKDFNNVRLINATKKTVSNKKLYEFNINIISGGIYESL